MALKLDGTDDFVDLKSNSELDFGAGSDFSIVAWIKIDTAAADSNFGFIATDVEWPTGGFWNIITGMDITHFLAL